MQPTRNRAAAHSDVRDREQTDHRQTITYSERDSGAGVKARLIYDRMYVV